MVLRLVEKVKCLLREYRLFPNKSLGQNFLIESSVFQVMSDCAALDQNDVVLDIGAGLGFLTCFLASKCKRVLAVELDYRLVGILHEQAGLANVKVICGNVLKVQLPVFNKIVSIPPYHISSRLLVWLLNKSYDVAVLILQKEFADRLVASAGNADYGWLTVLTHYRAECELLDGISRHTFYPEPQVDSIIVRLTPKKTLPYALKNEALFLKIVQSLFTQRNRRVRNAILPFLEGVFGESKKDAARVANTLPFGDKRVRELAPEDFGAMANALSN